MADPAVAERWPRFRRRKVLIQPWYQLRMAAIILLSIFAYSLLLGFLMFYPLYNEFAASANPDQQFWIARQVLELHKRFWPAVLVFAVLVAAQSIFVTLRVVGRRIMSRESWRDSLAATTRCASGCAAGTA